MTLDALPPGLQPVVVVVVASVIAAIVWRVFKLAVKLVLLLIVALVGGGLWFARHPPGEPQATAPSAAATPTTAPSPR